MSLGADRGRVQWMVLQEGGVLVAIGLALGVGGAFVSARVIQGLLFGVATRPDHVRGRGGNDGGDRDLRMLDSSATCGADRPGDHYAVVVGGTVRARFVGLACYLIPRG